MSEAAIRIRTCLGATLQGLIELSYQLGVQQHLRDQPDDLLSRYARRLASRPPSAGRLIVEPGRTIRHGLEHGDV